MLKEVQPPEMIVLLDIYKVAVGLLCLVLGALILYRTLPIKVTPMALLVGISFMAFGAYRLKVAWSRFRAFRASGQR